MMNNDVLLGCRSRQKLGHLYVNWKRTTIPVIYHQSRYFGYRLSGIFQCALENFVCNRMPNMSGHSSIALQSEITREHLSIDIFQIDLLMNRHFKGGFW